MPSADAYFRIADRRLTFLRQQVLELKAMEARYLESAQQISKSRDNVWRQLAGYLIPEVDEATLRATQEKLHFPGLLPIYERFTKKLTRAQKRRDTLEAMQEVAHREILEAPLRDELAEVTPTLRELEAEEAWWQSQRFYTELVARRWFKGGGPKGLWVSFKNWRAVSFLMRSAERERRLSLPSPEALRAHVLKLRADLSPLRAMRRDIRAKLDAIEALNIEYKETVQAPMTLGVEMFDALSAAIREALETTPAKDLFALARGDEYLTMFLKRAIGMGKQQSYLRELRVARIKSVIKSTHQQISKLERKVSKRRAKAYRGKFRKVSQSEYDGLQNLKEAKWEKRHKRLEKLHRRLGEFDRYEAGSFGEHFLWWDFMTKSAPADDLYEVRSYRKRQAKGGFDNHLHARLEAELPGSGGRDEGADGAQVMAAAAADAMVDDMLSGGDDWGTDIS